MRCYAQSSGARDALQLVESLQQRFVSALEKLGGAAFNSVEWLRDDGRHGGGCRYGIEDTALLGRASVNVSQVHYEDDPDRLLGSATAISTIVHPVHPLAPSVHIHISWTEQKSGCGYWRMMADLNPSIPDEAACNRFREAIKSAAPDSFNEATLQGDRYFYIPTLNRHRGIFHFYLESYNTGIFDADLTLARSVGQASIDRYIEILQTASEGATAVDEAQKMVQLAYHTLYFFQVLTLDRGTTAGLMVHSENDIGILGSLPARIDKNLLASWRSRMTEPQDRLLDRILKALPNQGVCEIGNAEKQKLADAVRNHYLKYPDALDLQASGNSRPPTIENHR
ncbi:MAG: coproporphyrinogen III oxidase [Pontiellaceae bacterium]|nr:coproporphyrinogen III oxidase [Pontiellaceae bacterium]MBN2784081.1 coproporphyrinogen III oxidase [Pontiellaceae bacterium]